MAENYFDNIRTVGAGLDQGIAKLQETWKMPQLILCNQNEEDQQTARKLIDNLRNELKLLKATIDENKAAVQCLRETQTQFLEESTRAIKCLKEEVDDIKVLFAENGYVEDPVEDDLSILNSQLESLFVNDSSSFLKDSNNITESSACDNASMCVDESSTASKESFNMGTPPINHIMHKKLLLEAMIGDTNLFLNDPDDKECAEIEIMIAETTDRGKGFGLESVYLMLQYGIEKLDIKKYSAKISMDNQKSINMFTKLGFKEISRSEVFQEITLERIVDDEWRDWLKSKTLHAIINENY
ncbi:hypothetical protein TSAR_015704 [Trichomalopsis sarcophagae]|uniref:N-acetyltransferase domain-containing protein n=1 Tax=Trichomalopsis sarcophagae TaxID=543379 RepID=A0A232F3W2_9HYME|nr:hypothetical protein TSAR_015704 [Trichomalopsis sarcophagae]